ncbi:winged helix-turn-helix domain-containing protein [Halobaculum gomorrense]|uniref:Sugar-specific transcriptional regulator TrmB n=1 Tax=Halobaculum gomorrense TaxID=43928 RepID=A0A1M5RMP7_9EURY|nr:winged helix-turn-helix domain-containing protein [Halobaculum gomorrense]SHH27406.1 Sugar-specific transcriptional regulator TrmB [Halobaculum gomorrense]
MATDEAPEDDGEADEAAESDAPREELRAAAQRLESGAAGATEEFDERIVDLLSWLLDTETRARIYVFLREHPGSTSEEVADETGLYPSTVREALAELHDEETVTRTKRESSGAGNNPYEYEAIEPAALVEGVVGQVQDQLNAVFTLDSRLAGDAASADAAAEPVRISVETERDME